MRNLLFPLSIIAGVVFGIVFDTTPSVASILGVEVSFVFFVVALCAGVALSWCWRNVRLRTASLIIALFAIGLWRGGSIEIQGATLSDTRATLVLNGVVATAPYTRGKTQVFDVRLPRATPSVNTTLGVITGQYPRYAYGDVLSIDCKNMKEGSCLFPTIHTLRKGSGNPAIAFLFSVKGRLVEGLSRVLPEPHASFSAALLLGERAALPAELRNAFQTTGTTHIVAVSGMHVVILGEFLKIILGFAHIPIRFRRGAIAMILVFFTAMIGAPASAVRGLLFGLLLLLAESTGRPRAMSVAIATTAAALLFLRPAFLFDLGFQLSFLAVIGIVYGVPVVSRFLDPLLPNKTLFRSGVALALVSFTATVMTTPLLVATFGRLSVIGIAANMVVVPFVEPATIVTLVVALIAVVHPFIALPFGILLFGILGAMMSAIAFFAMIPGAALRVTPLSPFALFVLYAILFVALFWQWRKLLPCERDFSLEKTSLSAR